jgi:hypothetical protein
MPIFSMHLLPFFPFLSSPCCFVGTAGCAH